MYASAIEKPRPPSAITRAAIATIPVYFEFLKIFSMAPPNATEVAAGSHPMAISFYIPGIVRTNKGDCFTVPRN